MRPEISPPSLQLLTFIVFFTVFPATHSRHQPPSYSDCQSSFECGNLKEISYPFWGNEQSHCGRQGFELQCQTKQYPVINMEGQSFIVLEIEQNNQWMKLARSDIWNGICPLLNTELNHSPFSFHGTGTRNISMFGGCPMESSIAEDARNVSCKTKNGSIDTNYLAWESFTDPENQCDLQITVPVLITAYNQVVDGTLTPKEALDEGFLADYHFDEEEFCKSCKKSHGKCVPADINSTQVLCICYDKPEIPPCSTHDRGYKQFQGSRFLGYGFASGVIFSCLVLVGYKTMILVSRMIKTKTMNALNVETYIRKYGSLAPKRYQCSDIKKITNSFLEKLGEGGFCSVYKGKLEDGRLVAVKVLKTDVSKGNGEEFLNEVISISRTSHVNIVSLIGYCYTTDKQALLFEFMPNGSLEKFIHNESISTAGRLAWDKLLGIAIGIARGLEYLHRGCSTRILHLDIKPHNVLLDENFCPKISDFGLSKLCPKGSVISMSGARGTFRYIAPELFSREFGRVSHKADVYSFGMMVLEIVGGRKNINESADDSSEIYYPHWVYDRLRKDNSLGLHGVITSRDNEISKKMIIIGLWCIQTYPVHRPSMNEVLFMLEGSLDALKIPPKPFIYTPSRTPLDL
ncbi:putative receptor-like protein kinase [Hibiscus syriacus]|uniref:non-specific serine/threonine protein kinase n=1 Tax=Hibiscus syriacus TaxID=106335 RepID=A0A6A2XKR8_HIBSY|nr:putative receptor-like protein kinase [Hibiscus syriacus]